jgi:hypothetical protein
VDQAKMNQLLFAVMTRAEAKLNRIKSLRGYFVEGKFQKRGSRLSLIAYKDAPMDDIARAVFDEAMVARGKLIESNVGYAQKLAWGFKNRSRSQLAIEELISAGMVGLVRAIDSYRLPFLQKTFVGCIAANVRKFMLIENNQTLISMSDGDRRLLYRARKGWVDGQEVKELVEASFLEYFEGLYDSESK